MTATAPPNASLFAFDNSYVRDLGGYYVACGPAPAPSPTLLRFNQVLAQEIGLDPARLTSERAAALFCGNDLPEGAQPIAQAYAGHQFGGFSPQLGDGRALLLGEVLDRHGRRRDIAPHRDDEQPRPRLRREMHRVHHHRAVAIAAFGQRAAGGGSAFPGQRLGCTGLRHARHVRRHRRADRNDEAPVADGHVVLGHQVIHVRIPHHAEQTRLHLRAELPDGGPSGLQRGARLVAQLHQQRCPHTITLVRMHGIRQRLGLAARDGIQKFQSGTALRSTHIVGTRRHHAQCGACEQSDYR